jgi:hypothetical protein
MNQLSTSNQQLTTINPQTIRYQCRHILTGGRRCASPALRHEQLCYHHHTIRQPIDPIALRTRRARIAAFDLPAPEDHTSIQHSLGEILSRLASRDLDHRRAGVMLYGLHIATRNLNQNKPKATPAEEEIVEEIVHDPILGPLAPIAEITRPQSFVANLHERLILASDLRLAREALAAAKQEAAAARQELEAAKQNNPPPCPPSRRSPTSPKRVPHVLPLGHGVFTSTTCHPPSPRKRKLQLTGCPTHRL